MENKYLPIFAFILFLAPLTSSLAINQGVTLSTSTSNSSLNFSFDINASNFTVQSNHIALQGINFTNSTATYTCDNVNHSTINSTLDSSEFNCTQQEQQVPSANGGSPSSNYYIKEMESAESLFANVKIASGKTISMDFVDDKGMGISCLQIKAKKYLSGNIEISEMQEKPDNCIIPMTEDYEIYKIFEINHTFENDLIGEVEVDVFVDEKWMELNNISKIDTCRCHPEEEMLKTTLMEPEKSQYKIYSEGFSTWAIIGLKREKANKSIVNESIGKSTPREIRVTPFITGKVIGNQPGEIDIAITTIIATIIILIIIFLITRKKSRKRQSSLRHLT